MQTNGFALDNRGPYCNANWPSRRWNRRCTSKLPLPADFVADACVFFSIAWSSLPAYRHDRYRHSSRALRQRSTLLLGRLARHMLELCPNPEVDEQGTDFVKE